MAQFNVTINELVSKATQLNEMNQTFKTQKDNLVELENGLNSMWEGDARTTFHNAFGHDVQQMEIFYGVVAKYVETLLNTAKNYQDAEMINVEIGKTRKY